MTNDLNDSSTKNHDIAVVDEEQEDNDGGAVDALTTSQKKKKKKKKQKTSTAAMEEEEKAKEEQCETATIEAIDRSSKSVDRHDKKKKKKKKKVHSSSKSLNLEPSSKKPAQALVGTATTINKEPPGQFVWMLYLFDCVCCTSFFVFFSFSL